MIIPAEVGLSSLIQANYDETSNNDELRLAKDGKVPQSEDEA